MVNGELLNDSYRQIDAAVSRLKETVAEHFRRAPSGQLYGEARLTATIQQGRVKLTRFGFEEQHKVDE